MSKRGLAIEMIILAAIGITVFIILFAIFANRLIEFNWELDKCPQTCQGAYSVSGKYTGAVTQASSAMCESGFSIPGKYSSANAQYGKPSADDVIRCSICCTS